MSATAYSEWIQIGKPVAMVFFTAVLAGVTAYYAHWVKKQTEILSQQTELLKQQTQNLLEQNEKRFVNEYFIEPLFKLFTDWRMKLPQKQPEVNNLPPTLNYDAKEERVKLALSEINYNEEAKALYLRKYPELEPELKSMEGYLNDLDGLVKKFNDDILNEPVMRKKVMDVINTDKAKSAVYDASYMFSWLITSIKVGDVGSSGGLKNEPRITDIREQFIDVRDKLLDKIDKIEKEIKKKPY